MEKQNWQDEAIKDSGIKVPEWELEGTGTEQKEAQEGAVEEMPSAAETRMAELAAETQAATPESLVEKAAQTEALRAEIAEMAKPEQKPADDPSHRYNTVTGEPNPKFAGVNTPEQSEKLNALHQTKRERNQSANTFFAEERNKDRTWWQKITGKGKLSAEDVAHEQALKMNIKVDKEQEMNSLFGISRTNTEVSTEAVMEVNKGIKEELEKLGVNLEALKENGFKFDQEVLTKEKEPALGALREKMGGAITNIFDKLAKIDKEHVVGVSVVVGLVAAMVPVLGLHDLQGVISMLPDSVSHFLQSPELAGNPLWSTITPDGNLSMPSVENYMHQVDVFNETTGATIAESGMEGNPFGQPVDFRDPNIRAKFVEIANYEQDLHRVGSAFANLATIPVVMGAAIHAGKIFGKIGKYFMGEKK